MPCGQNQRRCIRLAGCGHVIRCESRLARGQVDVALAVDSSTSVDVLQHSLERKDTNFLKLVRFGKVSLGCVDREFGT